MNSVNLEENGRNRKLFKILSTCRWPVGCVDSGGATDSAVLAGECGVAPLSLGPSANTCSNV